MKQILLSQNQVALVDDEDFEFLSLWKWNANKLGNTFYAVRNEKLKTFLMHRAIMNVSDKKLVVDHKDRNGLNNQKSNLRICTKSQNCANNKPLISKTSNYLGVSWDKNRNKWAANLTKNWKKIFLGRYISEREAAIAYNIGAKIHHGEFANLNIINDGLDSELKPTQYIRKVSHSFVSENNSKIISPFKK